MEVVVALENVVAACYSMVRWITRSRCLWVRVLRGKLRVLEQRLLIRRLLVQRLPLVQKLHKLVEEKVAMQNFMFQSL